MLVLLCACTVETVPLPEEVLFTKAEIFRNEAPKVDLEAYEKKVREEDKIKMSEPSGDNSSIVALHHTGDDGSYVFTITKVNAETTESAEFCKFSCEETEEFSYVYPGHTRRLFSEKFDKMAIDRIYKSDEGYQIGWMDSNGNWTNVSEALELSNDARSVGFFEDRFIFKQTVNGMEYICSVAFDKLSKENITPGNPEYPALTAVELSGDWLKNTEVTDWFENGNFLVNKLSDEGIPVNTYFADRKRKTLTEYIPSTVRENVCGVISPHQDEVAFLSIPDPGYGTIGIFITTMDYEETPYKLYTDLEIADHYDFDRENTPVLLAWIAEPDYFTELE